MGEDEVKLESSEAATGGERIKTVEGVAECVTVECQVMVSIE